MDARDTSGAFITSIAQDISATVVEIVGQATQQLLDWTMIPTRHSS